MSSRILQWALAAVILVPGGCSVFGEAYPRANRAAIHAFERGDFEEAAERFAASQGALSSNEFLSLAERGMARHVAGDLEGSTRDWLAAVKVLNGFEDRPTVSGRGVTEGLLSLALNDRTLPYDGEGFEVVLLHAFLAWDFLRLGRFDDAWVEVQLGYDAQKREEQRFETTYGMNRFARFLAGFVHELDGRPDEAEIDLVPLAEELPGNGAVRYALDRVQRLQGPQSREERGLSEVFLVFEEGRMAEKVSSELPYGYDGILGRVVVPGFSAPHGGGESLTLYVDGEAAGRTEVLETVHAVARANLDDRVAWFAGKSLIRSVAKTVVIDQVAREVEENNGEGAGIAVRILGGLLSYASEQADLRSWLTLPATIQALRVPVPPGAHEFELEFVGSDGWTARLPLGVHEAAPGRPLLVSARTLGQRLFASTHGGIPTLQPEPTTAP